MAKKLPIIVIVLILFSISHLSLAQSTVKTGGVQKTPIRSATPKTTYYRPDTVKNTDFSLSGQYQFMLSRSKTVNGYKLINPARLSGVWKSVSDTLRKERSELKLIKQKLAENEKTIASLQGEITGKDNNLKTAEDKVNEISFLGISFSKGTYQLTVWSIIGALAIALFIVIARSTKNILEAKHRTQLYEEISTEYQTFKTKSNEQQRKLARELQDERNLVEELRGR